MKSIKSKILLKLTLVVFISLSVAVSCSEDEFLDVPRTDQLSPDNFPNKPEDLDLMLIDLYGRLRNTLFNGDRYARFGTLMSHEADQAYIGAEFNFHAKNSLIASNGDVAALWNGYYENIAKCNAFLGAVENFRVKFPDAQPSEVKALEIREGQARFLRALNYFQAEAFFGETFIVNAGDESKMGIPLNTEVASSIEEASQPRATVGQVWDFVIEDLKKAEVLLAGVTWSGDDRARVSIWAVKALLGKTYLFTRKYAEASTKLKEVIDNSGKTLVSYDFLKNMYNGFDGYEFSNETLFELNYNSSSQGEWSAVQQTSTFMGIVLSPVFMNDGRGYDKNGFGNLYVHDKSVKRFGYNYADVIDENVLREDGKWKDDAFVKAELKDYLDNAAAIRTDKSVDPRLFISALQPYADSIKTSSTNRPIVKNQGEGVNLTANYTWSIRKYVILDRYVWASPYQDHNMVILRLADVYLMYAEALMGSGGDGVTALEYLNKVKRRAYGYAVDVSSPIDYATLSSPTKATDPVLANNPLRYERFTELFMEGHWWFDVARWKIGSQESDYYEKVGSGELNWEDRAYAVPIPEAEMVSNSKLKGQQNPGY
ncbi:MAG: RagB/SusD family nutrient uptake outer membrane protein [Chryseolinea sp.]